MKVTHLKIDPTPVNKKACAFCYMQVVQHKECIVVTWSLTAVKCNCGCCEMQATGWHSVGLSGNSEVVHQPETFPYTFTSRVLGCEIVTFLKCLFFPCLVCAVSCKLQSHVYVGFKHVAGCVCCRVGSGDSWELVWTCTAGRGSAGWTVLFGMKA